jgi:hypothetical protein
MNIRSIHILDKFQFHILQYAVEVLYRMGNCPVSP